jgi:glucose-1-phosphate cytidylyltransferase
MKVVILAGGRGTRISEESQLKPKPMIELGGKPILWHIMKIYHEYGFNDFIVCAGYKQEIIKEYFDKYYLYNSDITYNLLDNSHFIHNSNAEPWKVTVVDTGLNTMTGGRVKRIQKYIGNDPFLMTYGDAVSDINIFKLVEFHKSHGKLATLTAIQPKGRFGALDIDEYQTISQFKEKSNEDGGRINAGFMVLQPEIFDMIKDDSTTFEKEPLEKIAKTGNLKAYHHNGFWQCMDTMREKEQLENLIETNSAPWKTWED